MKVNNYIFTMISGFINWHTLPRRVILFSNYVPFFYAVLVNAIIYHWREILIKLDHASKCDTQLKEIIAISIM